MKTVGLFLLDFSSKWSDIHPDIVFIVYLLCEAHLRSFLTRSFQIIALRILLQSSKSGSICGIMTLEALTLHEVGHIFSCCESCVKNKRCKQIILVVTFVLMTFDVVTDWLNWLEWREVGGYDQYYFVSIFQKFFLTVAAVGTGLWILELFVLIKSFINFSHEEDGLIVQRRFHECLPEPEIPDDLEVNNNKFHSFTKE